MVRGAQKQSLLLVALGPGMSVPKGEIRRPLPHHLSKTCGTQKRNQSYLNVELTQSELTDYKYAAGIPGTPESNYVIISPRRHWNMTPAKGKPHAVLMPQGHSDGKQDGIRTG